MHELSLCHAIAGVVSSHAAGRTVDVVRVRVGALRQVVTDSLEFCWTIVREHEGLGDAELQIEAVPAAVECNSCGAQSEITSRFSICCPVCNSGAVSVLRGEEFLVTSIDVRDHDEVAEHGAGRG
ncbi:MAG: hydrogenase maturation nickel metallochaperone HypA [Actinomycetota bacterium]|nr:hydrogenase maturation nickel metallochaperone HypA [Actinomycetota bacterium]